MWEIFDWPEDTLREICDILTNVHKYMPVTTMYVVRDFVSSENTPPSCPTSFAL